MKKNINSKQIIKIMTGTLLIGTTFLLSNFSFVNTTSSTPDTNAHLQTTNSNVPPLFSKGLNDDNSPKIVSSSFAPEVSAVVFNIKGQDKLYMWGKNTQGQQGNGATSDYAVSVPTIVDIPYLDNHAGVGISQVDLSTTTSSILTTDNKIITWGSNHYGKMGKDAGEQGAIITTPIVVSFVGNPLSEIKIASISMTDNTSAIKTDNGDVYMWGANGSGQAGQDTKTTNILSPKKVKFSDSTPKIKQISTEETASYALTEDGDVYVWGDNSMNQYDNQSSEQTQNISNDKDNHWTPTLINFTKKEKRDKVESISTSGGNGSVLTESNKLYIWGKNVSGQMQKTPDDSLYNDEEITSPNNTKIIKFTIANGTNVVGDDSSSNTNCAMVTENNDIYSWGYNEDGELGIGTKTAGKPNLYIKDPTKVIGIDGIKITNVIFSGWSSFALTSKGGIYVWGANTLHQLGQNTPSGESAQTYGDAPTPSLLNRNWNQEAYIPSLSVKNAKVEWEGSSAIITFEIKGDNDFSNNIIKENGLYIKGMSVNNNTLPEDTFKIMGDPSLNSKITVKSNNLNPKSTYTGTFVVVDLDSSIWAGNPNTHNLSLKLPDFGVPAINPFTKWLITILSVVGAAALGVLSWVFYMRKKNEKLFDKYQNTLKEEAKINRDASSPQYGLTISEQNQPFTFKTKKEKREAIKKWKQIKKLSKTKTK